MLHISWLNIESFCFLFQPFFVERVFHIFDKDDNGSISLQEFIDAMHQFAGQSPDDKIKFLFKVYDIDGKRKKHVHFEHSKSRSRHVHLSRTHTHKCFTKKMVHSMFKSRNIKDSIFTPTAADHF